MRALSELAAGPLRQLPGAPGVHGARRRAGHHGRTGRRHDGDQPVRLLSRDRRRALPVPLRRAAGARPGAVLRDPGTRPAPARLGGRRRPPRAADRTVSVRRQSPPATGHRLHRAHGAGHPDVRGDARAGARIVPRHRLVAGADPAPPRTGGALRLRIPGAAGARRQIARRALGADGGLHRPARLGGGLRPRCRLAGARPDLGAVRRRGPHPARLHARSSQCRADHRRHRFRPGRLLLCQRGEPHPRGPARHPPVHARPSGRRSTRSARRWTPSCAGTTYG